MFSVMIPCHNIRHDWFMRTIRSITCQLDLTKNHVVIVDDLQPLSSYHSFQAKEFLRNHPGIGYVSVPDEGGQRVHNTCIELADQELVHIIHPDDFVLDGFYRGIRLMVQNDPDKAMYATASLWCDEDGSPFFSPRPNMATALGSLHEGNPLCVASCVVRKSAYKEFGGWNESLVHTGDWECWVRLALKGGISYMDWPMAAYRVSQGNHTSTLKRTGDNLRDYLRMADVVRKYATVDQRFDTFVRDRAWKQHREFVELGDDEAAQANLRFYREMGGMTRDD